MPEKTENKHNRQATNESAGFNVAFETFEDCRRESAGAFSDEFIDRATTGQLAVGGERSFFVKTYLDNVEATQKDIEASVDSQRLVDLYKLTTKVVRRNLELVYATDSTGVVGEGERDQIRGCMGQWDSKIDSTAADVLAVSTGEKKMVSDETLNTMAYKNLLTINDQDLLNARGFGLDGVRPSIKVQSDNGPFIMAYTKPRIYEKLNQQDQVLDRRIYLNPDLESAPLIFEKLLQAANKSGISAQIKMLQRAGEMMGLSRRVKSSPEQSAGGIRGDGIVAYVNNKDADELLGLALDIAREDDGAFVNRKTSRIPQSVADGVAIGDEPTQTPGHSLTSHRAEIISNVVGMAQESGLEGSEARRYFRFCLDHNLKINGVDPNNVAFNHESEVRD